MSGDESVIKDRDMERMISRKLNKRLDLVLEGVNRTLLDYVDQTLAFVVEMERLRMKICLTPEEVEKLYSLSIRTLKTDRCRGQGPPYIKDGRKVLYVQEELRKYLKERRVMTIE